MPVTLVTELLLEIAGRKYKTEIKLPYRILSSSVHLDEEHLCVSLSHRRQETENQVLKLGINVKNINLVTLVFL